jgi:signal transduction histidine kinase
VLLADSDLLQPARAALRNLRFQVDALISKVRAEILKLREVEGLITYQRLKQLCDEFIPTLTVDFEIEETALSPSVSTEVIAILTEILRNIASHSRATHVVIKMYMLNNQTCLEISDNGTGGLTMKDGHWGLLGMRERVEKLFGTLAIDLHAGTKITILL